jgi:hypothetical protein
MARGAAILKLPNRIAARGPETTPSQTLSVRHPCPAAFTSPPLLRSHAHRRYLAADAHDEFFKDA